ncbi:MAG: hypothetical protein RL412_818, partial [Pseudomonadota bacterium]
MPQDALICHRNSSTLPLWLVRECDLASVKAAHPTWGSWLDQHGFSAERQRVLMIPGQTGEMVGAVAGLGPLSDWNQLAWWQVSGLPDRLPARDFHLEGQLPDRALRQVLTGW